MTTHTIRRHRERNEDYPMLEPTKRSPTRVAGHARSKSDYEAVVGCLVLCLVDVGQHVRRHVGDKDPFGLKLVVMTAH